MDSLAGQVVHKRSVSKKLCFYDVVSGDGGGGERTTVAFKSWVCSQEVLEEARKGEGRIHVGDVVKFEGRREEGGGSLEALSFEVVESFGEAHPGETFASVPPSPTSEVDESDKIRKEKHCKYFLNTGKCPRTDQCPYRHVDKETLSNARTEYVKQKVTRRDRLQMEHEDGGEVSLTSRHQRAAIFARWIAGEFPAILSGPESVVLDVAGGRGDVAHEIKAGSVKAASRVVVVDPRGADKPRKRWQKKRDKKAGSEATVERLNARFDEKLLAQLRPDLVVAMHPDEATEPAVDAALAAGVPFAVVPCCVFAREFPDREGDPRTYEQFCEYLKAKAEGVSETRLGFRGRDRVLYWRPQQ